MTPKRCYERRHDFSPSTWAAQGMWRRRPLYLGEYPTPEEASIVAAWAHRWLRPANDLPEPGPLPATCPPARLVQRLLDSRVPLWALVGGSTPISVLLAAGCTVEELLAAGCESAVDTVEPSGV